jgi:hypothetical protein
MLILPISSALIICYKGKTDKTLYEMIIMGLVTVVKEKPDIKIEPCRRILD